MNPRRLAPTQAIPPQSQGMEMRGSGLQWSSRGEPSRGPHFILAPVHGDSTGGWCFSATVTSPVPRLCWTVEKWPAFFKNPIGNWLLCSLLRTSCHRSASCHSRHSSQTPDRGTSVQVFLGRHGIYDVGSHMLRETQLPEDRCRVLKIYTSHHSDE